MGQLITCTSVGSYEGALMRGQHYELLDHEEQKGQVKVCGNNARMRWFPSHLFDLSGGSVPVLANWWFDDPVQDDLNNWNETNNYVDVSFHLSDGQRRWLSFVTPDYLKQLLESRHTPARWGGKYDPGIWGAHMVVIHDLAVETVDWMLKHLDQQGELSEHSRPLAEPENAQRNIPTVCSDGY